MEGRKSFILIGFLSVVFFVFISAGIGTVQGQGFECPVVNGFQPCCADVECYEQGFEFCTFLGGLVGCDGFDCPGLCSDFVCCQGPGCGPGCAPPACGDGVINEELGEQCDCGGTCSESGVECNLDGGPPFGNCPPGESCLLYCGDPTYCAFCKFVDCGNGIVQPWYEIDPPGGLYEQCDDGNQNDGDGCSQYCQIEPCTDCICNLGECEYCCDPGRTATVWSYNYTVTCDPTNSSDCNVTQDSIDTTDYVFLSCPGNAVQFQDLNNPDNTITALCSESWTVDIGDVFDNHFDCVEGPCDYTDYTITNPSEDASCGQYFSLVDYTPPTTNCCEFPHAPGCEDQACEDIVCGADAICCLDFEGNEWDQTCADIANSLCGDADSTYCSPASILLPLLSISVVEVNDSYCGPSGFCGDGIPGNSPGEQCDDGDVDPDDTFYLENPDDDDGNCVIDLDRPPEFSCQDNVCGDGYWDQASAEQCDDGNTLPNDGCSPTCQLEDTDPPILTFVPPTPPEGEWNLDWVFINVTANEPLQEGSCSVHIEYLTGDQIVDKPMVMDPDQLTCFLNVTELSPGLQDGEYTFQVSANDAVGNPGSSSVLPITVFADPPVSTITDPLEGDLFNASNWTNFIVGTAADQQNGVDNVTLSIWRSDGQYYNGENWQPGEEWFLAEDLPGIPGEVGWDYVFLITEAEDGEFIVKSNATDTLGFQQQEVEQVTFKIDLNEPETTITNPQNGGTTGQPPTYSGVAIDRLANNFASGIGRVEYKVWNNETGVVYTDWTSDGVSYPNFPPPGFFIGGFGYVSDFSFQAPLQSGYNKVEVRTVDRAGNYGPPAEDTVYFDSSYPFVIITAPRPEDSPYNEVEWAAANPIRGEAGDDGTVEVVNISIQRVDDSMYWNGVEWQGELYWITAENQNGWSDWRWPEGIYTPDPGLYHLTANATDDAGKSSTTEVVVMYDPSPPFAWFDSPNSTWTTTPFIPVTWNGTDEGGGIVSFVIEWRDWTMVGDSGEWELLLPPTGQPGSANLQPVLNNHTYQFMVTATDVAGNQNMPVDTIVNTTVDLVAPLCDITGFGGEVEGFAASPLTITWNVEEGESGIAELGVFIKEDEEEWQHVNDVDSDCDPLADPYDTSTVCTLAENIYSFMCSAIDGAGNVGENSSIASITIDNSPPAGVITSPSQEWTNTVPFELGWIVTDEGQTSSGVKHVNVQWNYTDVGEWNDITVLGDPDIDPGVTSIPFGDGGGSYGDPEVIEEGRKFWFQVRGEDNVGNQGGWSEAVATTIDTVAPHATVTVTDLNGEEVNHTNFGIVSSVNITSVAEDTVPDPYPASGIANHTLWIQRTEEGIFLTPYPCGESEICSQVIEVSGVDEIVYWSEVEDHAGNRFVGLPGVLSVHPLANFVVHDIVLLLGSSYILPVQVRNLELVPLGYVELNLSEVTGYQLAGFIGGSGDFTEIVIAEDGKGVALINLQAGGRGELEVLLVSAEPGTSKDLFMTAQGQESAELPPTVFDEDVAHIRVEFPAGFSGLSEWAVLLLIVLTLMVYFFVVRKRKE